MDHIILGLLLLRSCSLYELRARMEAGLNLMYSSSMGSIQAAVRKLLQSGYIDVSEVAGNSRKKKIYSITAAGKEAFTAWVSSPVSGVTARNPELAKLYFMAFSDPASRVSNLKATLSELKTTYEILDGIFRQGEAMEVPENAREILHYQLASARYGRDFMKFQIDWYEKFLKEEEEQHHA